MADRATAPRWRKSTSFWHSLRRGPWPRTVTDRLIAALDTLAQRLRAYDAVVVFGSYARGECGRRSDVDLLIVLDAGRQPNVDGRGAGGKASSERAIGAANACRPLSDVVVQLISELESEWRLPVHLSPLITSLDRIGELSTDLLHNIWADGLVLFARAGALARLRPTGLAPWALVRFTASRARPTDRVRLSRQLHGLRSSGAPGIIRAPGMVLGRGTLLIPVD